MEGKSRAEIFGENLDRILQEKGLSRKAAIKLLNVSQAALALYITGKRTPSFEKLFEIAEILKVSVSSLLGDNKYNDSIPNVDEKIFEYRFKHAFEITKNAGIETKIIDDNNVEVQFWDMEDEENSVFDAVRRKIKIDKELFCKIVEMEEERLFFLSIADILEKDFKKLGTQTP